jgi:hypothetical protein
MYDAKNITWFIKAGGVAVAFLLLCALITPSVQDIPELPSLTKDSEQSAAVKEYLRGPASQITLVGTSLTHRLSEQFFLPLHVRNLGIPGTSTSTGLEIIASYRKIPKLILVEANVMEWPTNRDLVEKFSSIKKLSGGITILRPIQTAVAYFNNRPKEPEPVGPALDEILNQSAADYDNRVFVERAWNEWNATNNDELIKDHIRELGRIVSSLEARGSQVYFYELPLAGNLAKSHIAVLTRTAMHQQFTNTTRWLSPKYAVNELRFRDHAHLDERSALIVSRAMEAEIVMLLHQD